MVGTAVTNCLCPSSKGFNQAYYILYLEGWAFKTLFSYSILVSEMWI